MSLTPRHALSMRRSFGRLSLQTKTTIFVVGVCLVVVGLDAVNLWQERVDDIAQSRESTANLARSVGQHAEDAVRGVDAALVGLVERLENDGTTETALRRFAAVLRARLEVLPQLDGVTAADADGDLFVTSHSVAPKINIADRDYFQFHRTHAERGTHLGPPLVSRVTGHWVIPVSRRLDRPDGSFAGVIVATIDMGYFQRFYDTFEIGPHGTILLATDDALLLARRPLDETLVGKRISGLVGTSQAQSVASVVSGVGPSPIDRHLKMFARVRLPAYPLVVIATKRLDDVLADWRWHLRDHVIAGLVLATIIALLGRRLMAQAGMRQRAERELAEKQEHLLLAQRIGNIGHWVADEGTGLVVWSPQVFEIVGMTPAPYLTREEIRRLIHPDDLPLYREARARVTSRREAAFLECRLLRQTGEIRWARLEMQPRIDAQGRHVQTFGVVQDITAQRQAEVERTAIRGKLDESDEALRQSLAHIAAIAENFPGVIFRRVRHADGTYSFPFVSAGLRRIHGLGPEDIQRDPERLFGTLHPDDRQSFLAAVERSAEELTPLTVDYRIIAPDGAVKWLRGITRPHRAANGDTVWDGAILDVTEKLEIMQSLRDSELRYRLLAEHSSDAIVRLGLDGTRQYVSPAIERILGRAPQEFLVDAPMSEFLHPDDYALLVAARADLRNGKAEERTVTVRFLHRDGSYVWIEAVGRLVRDDATGEPVEIVATWRDISKRRLAEEALVAVERRLTDAVEAISEGFILFDADDRLVITNRNYVGMFPAVADILRPGISFEELMRQGAARRTRDLGSKSSETDILDALKWHREAAVGVELRLDDGRWILASERRTADGGTVGIRTDITRLKQVEEELNGKIADLVDTGKRLEAQGASLVEMAEGLAAARDVAEAAARSKSDFLAAMSHEIRTPMHGIIGTADLLLRGELDAAQRARAELLKESAAGLMSILNDILDVSKLEAGRVILETVNYSPATVIEQVVGLLSPKAAEKHLRLTAAIDERVREECSGDPTRLRQVLVNFVGNAIKFTDRGSVTVSARCNGDFFVGMCLQIDIVDTGIGISDEAKRQLFLKFSQADQSITRRFGGTGLGLAIAKELIEAMGGEVGVESRAGEGSRFWFTVPLRPAAAGRAADTVSAVEPSIDAPANGAGKRILLAEDVHINQIIATELLQSVGYVVDIAQNGEEAVQAAQAGGYDLVLMDVHMPLVDGLEATRRIRALDGPVSRIPIVALTADAVAGVRERYLAAGMDDFLSKPFEPATLFAMVERWTEDAGTAPVGVEERSAIAHDQLASVRNLMSEAKFTEFVSGCIAATRDRVGRMSRQAAGADLVDLAKEAHSLIGTAGAIGGTRLIVLARRLEDVCKAGGTVEARQLVAELSAEADDACTELERRFKAA